jgi:ATP-binding cassette subfamily B protein
VIGHRLSTISLAEEIVVMDAGRITDRGSHEQLLGRSGLYRSLVVEEDSDRPRYIDETIEVAG